MPDKDFNPDLRDIRFVLFEQLPFAKLQALPEYAQLDREQVQMLIDECAKFSGEVIAPLNRPGDREGCHFDHGQVTLPQGYKEAYQAFRENGWIGVTLPEAIGGMGLPRTVGVITAELDIGACCAFALSVGLTHAATALLAEYGTDEMKRVYVPKLASGEWQGTMCLTEPGAGSAVGDIKTIAKPDGDTWLLSGTKCFITAGEHDMTPNHVHLVLARTPGAPKGFKGISLFLVPKRRPTADGQPGEPNDVVCAGIEHKMGIKGSPTCTMSFGEDGKCRAWLIGEVGKGLQYMFHMMNEARVGVGIQGLALAAAATQYATAYANERVQGVDVEKMRDLEAPRVLIKEHPDVRRMLLFCKSIVEGSRALLYYTAFCGDMGRSHPDAKERERSMGTLELLTPICKAWVSDRAFEVAAQALQVMGGYGYIGEYPVEQHLRDVKIASIYEGTNGIQALDLLGRKLPMKGGAVFMGFAGELARFAEGQKAHLALGDLAQAFGEEVARWQATTSKLAGMGMSGDQRYPILSATPFLEMTGNVMVAWMLLGQAIVAHDKLQGRYLDQQAMDPAARARLRADDAEARFYANKLETARFFIHHVLPRNRAIAAEIDSGDRSPLNFVV
jgi:alkylation response protein AidB-like acyl-CoA dehydrogenase